MTARATRVLVLTLLAGNFFEILADHKQLKAGFNLFSKEQDVHLGQEAATKAERDLPIVRDRAITDYIQGIGRRLSSQPQAGGFPYTFKVVNESSINAFALPGGPTYVNTGLLRAADNEGQLAGVMAHEIAHVALRHGTNQTSKANLIQLPAMIAGAVLGGNGSMLGQLSQLGIGLGANSVLMKFSRSAESEADLLGTQLMARAGYNPIEMARFFEKLEAQGGRGGPEFFASHPNPGNRRKAIEEEIRTLPQRNYAEGESDGLRRIQAQLASLPPTDRDARAQGIEDTRGGQVPRDGQVPRAREATRPSDRLREFQARDFSISYPDNWEVFGSNDSAMVTIAPREGIVQARNGTSTVGYGAIMSFFYPQYNDGRVDLDRDTRDLIAQLKSSNPTMRADGNSRRIRVERENGLLTTLTSESPFQGESEVDLLVTVTRPQGLFYFVFISPRNEPKQVRGVFRQMVRSVRFPD